MRPAIDSGIVTADASVSYWPIFPSPGNSPRSLCESKLGPFLFWFQKWRIGITSMGTVFCNIKPFLLFQQIWTKAEWRYRGSWNAG